MFTRLAIAAVLSALSLAPAVAQESDSRQVSVRVDDLNLASPAGQRALAFRIRGAVDQVCPSEGVVGLEMRGAITQCRAEAMTAARRDVARMTPGAGLVIASR